MSALAIFGICILITLALIIIPILFIGEGLVMLVIIFPSIFAKAVTGERGVDFGGKSFVYSIFLFLFVAIEIALMASVFFGFYCLFFGYPITEATNSLVETAFSDTKLNWLLHINELLFIMISLFLGLFIYNSIKRSEQIKKMSRTQMLLYRLLPILSFPIGFVYLYSTLHYLEEYPSAANISSPAIVAGYLYALYIIHALFRSISSYITLIRYNIKSIAPYNWLMFFIGLFFNSTFLYFFYQINSHI